MMIHLLPLRLCALGVAALLTGCAADPAAIAGPPVAVDPANRESAYPVGNRDNFTQPQFILGSLSAMDSIFPARPLAGATTPRRLSEAGLPPRAIRFDHGGQSWTLERFLTETPTTGLLVLRRDGTVLLERLPRGRRPEDRFMSWSMSKTMVAMLAGIAIAEGRLNLDDTVARHVPALAGSAYAEVPVRHLLTMSSGARFDETYGGPGSDVTRLWNATARHEGPGGAATVAWISGRTGPAGQRFSYSSADTQVLGLVVAAAMGRDLLDLTTDRLWRPMGAEAEARWLVDASGFPLAYGGVNARLRDYGRLGLLMVNEGRGPEGQVIPAAWVRSMLTPTAYAENAQATGGGYGQQIWLSSDGALGMFRGIRGQWIAVHPTSGIVVVRTAALGNATSPEDSRLTRALVFALIAAYGD